MLIREATSKELDSVLTVEREAFGEEDEAELVKNLLNDPSAKPLLSLLAFEGDEPIGHILFTTARLDSDPEAKTSLLAPLAVIPKYQKIGVGAALIKEGLRILQESGFELVFVLGHPSYYPRCGFKPAGVQGLDAPYPIPDKDADAWMVQPLQAGAVEKYSGKLLCADALNKPEYWRE